MGMQPRAPGTAAEISRSPPAASDDCRRPNSFNIPVWGKHSQQSMLQAGRLPLDGWPGSQPDIRNGTLTTLSQNTCLFVADSPALLVFRSPSSHSSWRYRNGSSSPCSHTHPRRGPPRCRSRTLESRRRRTRSQRAWLPPSPALLPHT